MTSYELTVPISERQVRGLRAGDSVQLSGTIVTARDAAHKYLVETLVNATSIPASERELYAELARLLAGGFVYHCGPVVRQTEDGWWQFVAAGPTTSIREEMYEPAVIAHFGLRGVIGKGGMGEGTREACREHGAVYLHAVGGAATLIAATVRDVLAVHKLREFGVPEAVWVISVERFPAVVTMDSYGKSVHDEVQTASYRALQQLL